MRLIFMGTPAFSVPALNEILGQGHDIAAVYTQPPRPAGRGMGLRKSPVHAFAEASGLAVRHPESLRDPAEQARFAASGAEAAVVVAYGLILPRAVLDAPALGCYNIHASLLPRWRGAAPIQRAIMAGDERTGISIMRMEAGLDTGPVCLTETVPITAETTAGDLHDQLAEVGASLMVRALAALSRGGLACNPQRPEGVTYAEKIGKAEAHVDLNQPAGRVLRHIHGLSPHPGAWVMLDPAAKPVRLKLLRVQMADGEGRPGEVLDDALTIACASGAIRPLLVQREGKSPMETAEFLRGTPIPAGTELG
ncbi:methionyl-tRNA formyltransferase [Rhodoligotrophos defluvii]|uniref:methionyl-tRNA formyltransferase n=1 Tax=Rhodoligotrophos defluvii TaxID=2561934 RepID=UPI0010C97EFF|nr:methionyl-tRNA formyltransferase [Rhodoligotrophos defluvii]